MFYKMLNGKKYLVDSKGMFLKNDDSEMVEAPSDSSEFVEDEESDTEVAEEIKALVKSITMQTTKGISDSFKQLNIPNEINRQISEQLGSKSKEVVFTKSLGETEKTITKDDVVSGMKTAGANKNSSFEFNIKTLSELNSLTGELPEEDRQPGVTSIAKPVTRLVNVIPQETTTSKTVTWVEALSETGSPATVAELALFPNKDYTYTVMSATVYKIGVTSKMSNEVLEDLPQLVEHVQGELRKDLELKVERSLTTGTGVNEVTGILTVAPAFTGGNLAGTVATPNKFDVLRASASQIRASGFGKFVPNTAFMNPEDVASLDLEKDANGNYIMPPFTNVERTVVKGLVVIENDAITAGDFVVFDSSKFHAPVRRQLSVQISTENEDDFVRDIVTVRLSERRASYVKANEVNAFVQGDFATAITTLTL